MSAERHGEILSTFDDAQLSVLRLSIMAERRLRTHYQREPSDRESLDAAYAWAREQVQ